MTHSRRVLSDDGEFPLSSRREARCPSERVAPRVFLPRTSRRSRRHKCNGYEGHASATLAYGLLLDESDEINLNGFAPYATNWEVKAGTGGGRVPPGFIHVECSPPTRNSR